MAKKTSEKSTPAKKPKFKVTKVSLRPEASVSKYLRESANKADLAELLKGVKDMKNWSFKTDKDNNVVEAYPNVSGHPGHVHGKDWKLYVERGTGTKDRLILAGRKYKTEPSKRDPNMINIEISCNGFVETDTH